LRGGTAKQRQSSEKIEGKKRRKRSLFDQHG